MTFLLIQYNKYVKRSNHLRRRFVTLVHKRRGVLCFDIFAHTVVISRKNGQIS